MKMCRIKSDCKPAGRELSRVSPELLKTFSRKGFKYNLLVLLVMVYGIWGGEVFGDVFIKNLPLTNATAYDPEPTFIKQEGSAFGGTTGFISPTDGRIYHNSTICASAISGWGWARIGMGVFDGINSADFTVSQSGMYKIRISGTLDGSVMEGSVPAGILGYGKVTGWLEVGSKLRGENSTDYTVNRLHDVSLGVLDFIEDVTWGSVDTAIAAYTGGTGSAVSSLIGTLRLADSIQEWDNQSFELISYNYLEAGRDYNWGFYVESRQASVELLGGVGVALYQLDVTNLSVDLYSVGDEVLHTVYSSSGANGTITPSGEVTVSHDNSSPSFYAIPDQGYEIDHWYIDGEEFDISSQPSSLMIGKVTSSRSIGVTFKEILPEGEKYVYRGSVTSRSIGDSDPWSAINPTTQFDYLNDPDHLCVRVELLDVYRNGDHSPLIEVWCRFYKPNNPEYPDAGEAYGYRHWTVDAPETWWSYYICYADEGHLSNANFRFEYWPGRWTYRIYIDEGDGDGQELIEEKYFDILAETVETPTFSPDGDSSTSPLNVTINCATSGATIRYTTDGTIPNGSDPAVASGSTVPVDQSLTLRAKAWKTYYFASGVKSANYIVTETVATPTQPSGESSLRVDQSGTYTTSGGSSSLSHPVEYQFDWGDGTQSVWGSATQSHSWSSEGSYAVEARSRCQTHTNRMSGWSSSFVVTVNTNRTPVLAAIGSKSVNEGSLLSFSVSATDADGDAITYSASPLPNGAVFSGQTFTWTPGHDQAGSFNVTFTASDGTDQDSETITITVNNVNGPPELAWIGNQSASVGSLLSLTISATDPDNDPITYSATGLPSGASFSGQTFSWTPGSGQEGTYNTSFIASDGTAQDSETITIAVGDNLAPSISNLLPAAGSIQVPLNSLITLHVTDSGIGVDAGTVVITLDGATIYTGDTTDYSSATGICHRAGTVADYTYAYQSDEAFDFDELKTVTVNAADLGGIVMTEQSYSFRMEMRSFGQNKQVSLGLDNLACGSPATVCDSSGDIWAVWHAGPVGSRDIYVGKLTAGADTFGTSVRLTSNSADQSSPAVALGTGDRLYVVWQDNRRGNWDIYGSTSTDGTSWVAERRIADSDDNQNFNQINPAIVVNGQSSYVAWEDDRGANNNKDIYIATSADGFATNAITQVTSDASNQTAPAVAVDSSNTVYVLWTDARNVTNGNDIYGAASNNGPWTNQAIVAKPANQSHPVIAVESSGSVLHMAWVDRTSGNSDIYYASSTGLPGSPLAGSNHIDNASSAEQLSPTIAVSGTGSGLGVFACWQDERNISGGIGDTDLYMVQANSGSGTNVFVGDDGTKSSTTGRAGGMRKAPKRGR